MQQERNRDLVLRDRVFQQSGAGRGQISLSSGRHGLSPVQEANTGQEVSQIGSSAVQESTR